MESHEKDLRSVVESDEQRATVQADYRSAGLTAREVALLDFAVKLTKSPTGIQRSDLDTSVAKDSPTNNWSMLFTASVISTPSTGCWTVWAWTRNRRCGTARTAHEP